MLHDMRRSITLCETGAVTHDTLRSPGRNIGHSIQEAIDWTQDRLKTTRPLAERTLFSMLADKKINETEDGFMILEDEDDDETKMYKRHKGIKSFGQYGGYRFHRSRWIKHKEKIMRRLEQLHAEGGRLNPRDATMVSEAGDDQDTLLTGVI